MLCQEREPLVIFIALMVSRQLTEEPDRSNMCNGLNLIYPPCYSMLDAPSGPGLDLLYVQQSGDVCENHSMFYFDTKHLEKGLNRRW